MQPFRLRTSCIPCGVTLSFIALGVQDVYEITVGKEDTHQPQRCKDSSRDQVTPIPTLERRFHAIFFLGNKKISSYKIYLYTPFIRFLLSPLGCWLLSLMLSCGDRNSVVHHRPRVRGLMQVLSTPCGIALAHGVAVKGAQPIRKT